MITSLWTLTEPLAWSALAVLPLHLAVPGLEDPTDERPAAGLIAERAARREASRETAWQAVDNGLEWLLANQEANGDFEGDVGTTGRALLALLGGGSTPSAATREALEDGTRRAANWLLERLDSGGGFAVAELADDAAAVAALAEAAHFSKDALVRTGAQRAARALEERRGKPDGWSFGRTSADEALDAAWGVLALRTAADCGLEVAPQTFLDARSWTKELVDPEGRPHPELRTSSRATAELLRAALLFTRVFDGEVASPTQLDGVAAAVVTKGKKLPRLDLEHWFYGAQGLALVGGRTWKTWSDAMGNALFRGQRKSGKARGSWSASRLSMPDANTADATALAVLALQADYRYARLAPQDAEAPPVARESTGAAKGGRFGRRRPGAAGAEQGLKDALRWLHRHQAGNGSIEDDVRATALMLLAFLGDGHTTHTGTYRDSVTRGVEWLLDRQEASGALAGPSELDAHAIATLALVEANLYAKASFEEPAQRALEHLSSHIGPGREWSLASPLGDAEGLTLYWALVAQISARETGLSHDEALLERFDRWTQTRVDRDGSLRVEARNADRLECLSASTIFLRFFLGHRPDSAASLSQQAKRLEKHTPDAEAKGFRSDLDYWLQGAYSAFQLGNPTWRVWRKPFFVALLGAQSKSGDTKGSFDASLVHRPGATRAEATAKAALCLEVFFRYARVAGSR